jgi:hypothetical protein
MRSRARVAAADGRSHRCVPLGHGQVGGVEAPPRACEGGGERPSPRGHCGGARHRREGLQRIVRFHQHSKHPGHRCRWARFSGVADYRDVCLATRGVPAEVGCRLRPACWAATRLQATMGTLIEGKVFAFELQEDLCEHACSVGAVVLRLWAGRATGTAILRGGLRDAGAR